jgi:hypothetical protein
VTVCLWLWLVLFNPVSRWPAGFREELAMDLNADSYIGRRKERPITDPRQTVQHLLGKMTTTSVSESAATLAKVTALANVLA